MVWFTNHNDIFYIRAICTRLMPENNNYFWKIKLFTRNSGKWIQGLKCRLQCYLVHFPSFIRSMKIFMDSDPKMDHLKVNRQLKLLDWDGIEVGYHSLQPTIAFWSRIRDHWRFTYHVVYAKHWGQLKFLSVSLISRFLIGWFFAHQYSDSFF